MNTWIALFKGINVGGNNKIPMKELVSEFQALGFLAVKSYIQSGNVVFQTSATDVRSEANSLSTIIAAAVHSRFNITTHVIVLSQIDLAQAISANPFTEVQSDEEAKQLHLFFLKHPATRFDQSRLDSTKKPSERWEFKGGIFYLHTPDGFGESKLAMQVEKIVGVPVSARNWRTIGALFKLASTLG